MGLVIVVVGLTAGCATTALTAEQSTALDRFAACRDRGAGVVLAEVRTDGTMTLEGFHSRIEAVKQCLAERFGYAAHGDPRLREIIRDPGGA